MKIYSAENKVQGTKIVYDGHTYTTVALPSSMGSGQSKCKQCDINLTKSIHPEVTPTHRQTRCWTFGITACCIFGLVASIGLFGLLYSAANPVSYSTGECAVPILPDEQKGVIEVMTADEETKIETFDVPEINARHPATILHDFYNEVTVYLDRAEGVCFVMTLNTSQVVPPKSLLEAFIRYKRGDFSLNLDVIRETMHVEGPAITDPASFGIGAEVLCNDLPMYRLVKISSLGIRKRSVSTSEHRVTYFNGLYMVELTVTF